MIYACLSKCKTKRQHMYMYIIFKSSIIYFYHWLILTCLKKRHFLNNINCKKIFYTERQCYYFNIFQKKRGIRSKIYLCSKKFDGWRTLETTISQFWYNMFIEILTWPQGLDKSLDKRNEMFILFNQLWCDFFWFLLLSLRAKLDINGKSCIYTGTWLFLLAFYKCMTVSISEIEIGTWLVYIWIFSII